MAIQMRRGAYAQFDPSKMKAGEWAVSTDSDAKKQQIWMCFAPGVVKRMGTVEDFDAEIQRLIQDYLDGIVQSVSQAQKSAQSASQKADEVARVSGKIDTALSQANAATAKANEAAQKAEQQAGLVEQKANGRGITFSVTSAGLLNVSKED